MQYRKEFMPITCGAYNSLPVPYQQGAFQNMSQNSSIMGLQQVMPTQHTMTSQQAMSTFPTGVPGGTPHASAVPTGPVQPGGIFHGEQVPVTVESTLFTPGFLRTQIGRRIRVEFLLGTNLLTDRTGTLVAVGASYILLRPIDSDDLMMCDIYSIKFVTIIL